MTTFVSAVWSIRNSEFLCEWLTGFAHFAGQYFVDERLIRQGPFCGGLAYQSQNFRVLSDRDELLGSSPTVGRPTRRMDESCPRLTSL